MCGLRDKQACRQTLAACLLTDLCEDTRSSASLPYLLKHSQSMMNGGLFQFSSSMHILKKGCKILLGSEFTTFWFDSHARGLVRDEVFLIALGYFVWVGGLTHHAREDAQRVAELFFSKGNRVFAASSRRFQTAMSDGRKKKQTCSNHVRFEWMMVCLIQRCFYLLVQVLYIMKWFWVMHWKTGPRQCMRR